MAQFHRNYQLKIDYAWKNGSLNLIKPIGFDLTDENSINVKAVHNYGFLNLLSDKAVKENYRFDLLISEPQNKKLFSAYEKALKILEASDAPKKIITETVGKALRSLNYRPSCKYQKLFYH